MCSNLLACDVGLKRIGLACYTNGIVLPIEPILRKNRNQASMELKALLEEKKIEVLVVGIPQSEDGDEHEMQRRIRHFISLVEFEGEIVYVDESFSSAQAYERMMDLGRKERSQKIKNGELDSLSAMIILERYLAK